MYLSAVTNDVVDLGKKLRTKLLEANVASVDADVAAAKARGLALGEIVAIVADLREALARPFLEAAAQRQNASPDELLARIASGSAARIDTCAITRAEAVAHFETSYPQLSQALAQFPSGDRVWIVVVAAGAAALVSRAPRG